MTEPDDEQGLPSRRPPAAPSQWATVTRLASREPEIPGQSTGDESARVDGSLALDPAVPRPLERGLPETPELRLVPRPDRDGAGEEVRAWAARFAQAVVEVLGGDRPLSQLLRWTSHRVYLELDRRLTILTRTSDAGRRMRTIRPQVRSVHVCHPTATTAEVSVHVRHGQRSRAIAARLELIGGRWQCTALQLG